MASRSLRHALDRFASLDAGWEDARTRLDLASALVSASPARARAEAAAAYEDLARIGAARETSHARDLLASLGVVRLRAVSAPASRIDPCASPLDRFSPATRGWFQAAFPEPTPAQAGAWDAIASGEHALVVAPTGSGKTLAAFLWALDRLANDPAPLEPSRRLRVVYVSPLKALAVDVERNLRSPLVGMRGAAQRLGLPEPSVDVPVRTGDTPAEDRRRFGKHPAGRPRSPRPSRST